MKSAAVAARRRNRRHTSVLVRSQALGVGILAGVLGTVALQGPSGASAKVYVEPDRPPGVTSVSNDSWRDTRVNCSNITETATFYPGMTQPSSWLDIDNLSGCTIVSNAPNRGNPPNPALYSMSSGHSVAITRTSNGHTLTIVHGTAPSGSATPTSPPPSSPPPSSGTPPSGITGPAMFGSHRQYAINCDNVNGINTFAVIPDGADDRLRLSFNWCGPTDQPPARQPTTRSITGPVEQSSATLWIMSEGSTVTISMPGIQLTITFGDSGPPPPPPPPPTPVALADALNDVRYLYPDRPPAVNGFNVGLPGQNFRDHFIDCDRITETATYNIAPTVSSARSDLLNFQNCTVVSVPNVNPSVAGNARRRVIATNGRVEYTNPATGRTLTVIYGNVPAATSALSSASARGVVGQPLTPVALTAINFAPNGFSVDPALPDGLSIDPATGQVSGTPTAPSSGQYAITASDGTKQGTGILTLEVSATPAYVVTFDQEIGTNPYAATVTPGESVALPTTNSLKSNSVFAGWRTAPEGGGDLIGMPGASFTPSSSLTLYADWKPRVTITFQRNLTSDPHPVFPPELAPFVNASSNLVLDFAQGSLMTLPVPTRAGNAFLGWTGATSCPGTGAQNVANWRGGAQVVAPSVANRTLRACWTNNQQFDFNANGGTFPSEAGCQMLGGLCRLRWNTSDPIDADSGLPTIVLPEVTRDGYAFDGWFTAASGGTRVGTSGERVPLTVLTAQAQWTSTRTPPGPPRDIVAVPGDQQVTLSWIAPESDGGAPVTGYQVTGTAQGQPDVSCDTTDTTCTIDGLTNGRRYTFRIVARNSEGSSAPTDAMRVTPSGSTWIPTPENTAPTPPPTRGEAQREGRTAVALNATAPAPGRLSFVAVEVEDEEGNGGTGAGTGDPTPPEPRQLATVAFEGDPSSDAIRGLVARTDRSVVCEVCTDLTAGTELEVWAFSTPRRITTAQVGDDGCVEFVVPLATPMDGGSPIEPGLHTLQVALPLEDGRLAINVAVTVPEPPPPPAADAPTQTPVTWIPTPENAQPRVPGARGEMQREGGQPVQLAAISSHAGEVGYVDDDGLLSVVFTGDTTTSVERGLVATREDMVRCEVCGEMAPGSIVEIWAFSTPRLVAAAVVDERGCIDVMIPLSAPLDGGPAIEAGQHTLQVVLPMDDGLGRLAVNVGVTVGGLTPTSLPAGEGMPTGAAALLGMLGAALAVLVPALRRGRVQGAAGSI